MEQMRPGRNGGKLKVGGSHPRAGRPKNILNKIEEAICKQFTVSFSKVDKLRIMESMLEMSMADIAKIIKDPDAPAFMVVMANSIKGDIERKNMKTVDELFARFYGRPGKEAEQQAETKEDPLLQLMKLN